MPTAEGTRGACRDRPLASAFAELFLARAPPEFLQEQSTDALAHVVPGAFRFLHSYQSGVVDVQVFDPIMELEMRNVREPPVGHPPSGDATDACVQRDSGTGSWIGCRGLRSCRLRVRQQG